MHSNLLYSSLNLYLSNLDSAILAPVDENGGEMGCDEGIHAARGPGHIRVRIWKMFWSIKIPVQAQYVNLSG